MPEIKKKRLMGGLTLILITGFLLIIFISFFVSRHSLQSQIINSNLPLSGDNIYAEIRQDLLKPILISSAMASDTFVRDWILHGENDSSIITKYLNEILKKYNFFTTFIVSDKTFTYYHADGLLKQVHPEEPRDAWYYRVRKAETPFEINVDIDMANNDALTVFINYRMFDFSGKYIGVTGVGITVNELKDIIKTNEEKFNRRIFFVDSNGNIKLAGNSFPASIKNLSDIKGLEQYQKLLQQEGTTLNYNIFFSKTYTTSKFIPEFNWYLIVEEKEQQELNKLVYTLFINLAICSFVIVIILLRINFIVSRYHTKIEKLAITDKLTGIFNRRALDMFMNQIMLEKKREKDPLTLILFDLDHFKQVNDDFGHLAGDETIKSIIKLVKASIRESDFICRWGGEEFLILLKNCNLENGIIMAENIRRKVERHTTRFNDHDIRVTVSLGVVELQHNENTDTLLQRVDNALYNAKTSGRNRVSSKIDIISSKYEKKG